MTRYRRRFRMRRLLRRIRRKPGGALAVLAGIVLAAAVHASGAAPAITARAAAGCAASDAVCTGQQMAAARGWTGPEWACLDQLWTRESGWSAYAANPTSDARGIPQNINGWAAYATGDVAGAAPPGSPRTSTAGPPTRRVMSRRRSGGAWATWPAGM